MSRGTVVTCLNRTRTSMPNLARYERIAPLYDLLDFPFERRRYQALRPLLFQNLKGRLLDAGIGTGRKLRVLSAGDGSLGDRYQPGHAGTGAPPVPDPVGGRSALPDGRHRARVSGRLVRRGSSDIPVLCSAREPTGPGVAGTRSRGQAGRPNSAPRICPTAAPYGGSCRGCGIPGSPGLMAQVSIARLSARPDGRP
jgi:hypothetical protein